MIFLTFFIKTFIDLIKKGNSDQSLPNLSVK